MCEFCVQSCMHRARRGLLVLVVGIFQLSQNRWRARRMRQSHKTDAPEHVTARRWLRLTLGDVPRGAAGGPRRASRVRISSWARAPSSPRYTALVDAPLRSVCRASPCCGKPYRTAPPTRLTPSLRPRSPPSSTPPEVCLETTWYHHHTRATFVTQGSLGHDEHALPGRAFLAPAPSRAAAHLVITRKEIRCTRCHSQK